MAFALGACSSGAVSPPMAGQITQSTAATAFASPARRIAYETLYSFQNGTDGTGPQAGLVAVKGTLYGTTQFGGGSGAGSVFKVSPSGKERILYSFKGGSDGANPVGSLLYYNGYFYGTTPNGGAGGTGTVFAVNAAGHEHLVYSFGGVGGTDSANPQGALIVKGGVLYGTASSGGTNAEGTVFAVTPSGSEHTVYSFAGPPDAYGPSTGLVAIGADFYGVTYFGGTANIGAVFAVNASGTERVVYSFLGGTDGALPQAGLIAVKGALYGTTLNGGCQSCGSDCNSTQSSGCGTVFTVNTAGSERVLHSFKNSSKDGASPVASLVALKSELYGTTSIGGGTGNGSVFKITTAGKKEGVLHSFRGGPSDGATPDAGLIALSGKFYGTTSAGGKSFDGTVYELTP